MYNFVGKKIKELLVKYGKSAGELSEQTGIPHHVLGKIINGGVKINSDMAIRLGKVFPDEQACPLTGYKYWLYLQFSCDVWNAEDLLGPMYRNIKPFKKAN